MKELKEKFIAAIKAMDFSDKSQEELFNLVHLCSLVRDLDGSYKDSIESLANIIKESYILKPSKCACAENAPAEEA